MRKDKLLRIFAVFLYLVAFHALGQTVTDTCSEKPFIKKRNYTKEELSNEKTLFYRDALSPHPFFSYIHYETNGDCNSEGVEIANHEWKGDTLRIYTFWCHAGDPGGWEWGGRIMEYKWDCANKKLLKIDARLYIEMSGMPGGMPLAGGETDPEIMQQRKAFKQDMAKQYKARFVSGKEATALVNRAREFLKTDIDEATKHWKKAYGPDGGAGSGFGYRK
jgi:hypothetical protein